MRKKHAGWARRFARHERRKAVRALIAARHAALRLTRRGKPLPMRLRWALR